MQKTILNEVFNMLCDVKAVASESAFSKEWLGRSECYLRTLRFKGMAPSVATIALCASKLQHYGDLLVRQNQHRDLGEKFLAMSKRCHAQVNAESHARWPNP